MSNTLKRKCVIEYSDNKRHKKNTLYNKRKCCINPEDTTCKRYKKRIKKEQCIYENNINNASHMPYIK